MGKEPQSKHDVPERAMRKKDMFTSAIMTFIPIAGLAVGWAQWQDARYEKFFLPRTEATTFYLTRKDADIQFAKLDDVIVVAEANTLKHAITTAQNQADSNAKKLDAILITSAIAVYQGYARDVAALEADKKDTREWIEKYSEAKKNRDGAKEYRDCLINKQENCEFLQVGR